MTARNERYRKQSVGILFGPDSLYGCHAIRTIMGKMRYEFASVPVSDDLVSSISGLLAELGVSQVHVPIAAAIPTSECSLATRPSDSEADLATAETRLRESLVSSSEPSDELLTDIVKWRADRRHFEGIVAAPKERIEQIRSAVKRTGHPLHSLQPAADALIGAAVDSEKNRRQHSFETRIFLGEASVLAAVCQGSRAIHWQSDALLPGDEGAGIVSVYRNVEATFGDCGLERMPQAATIYGRQELESLIDMRWVRERLPNEFRWAGKPSMTAHEIAQACAYGALGDNVDGFDFVREFRTPLKLHRIIPYRDIVLYTAAAIGLATVLTSRLDRIQAQRQTVQANATAMGIGGENPRPERDRLDAKASAISSFLDQRIQWSSMLHDVTASLPEGTRLTAVRGTSMMTDEQKLETESAPSTLILNAECVLDEQGQLPRSVSSLAQTIGALDSVSKHFGRAELTDVRRTTARTSGVEGAEFSIVLSMPSRSGK